MAVHLTNRLEEGLCLNAVRLSRLARSITRSP